jgi:photosystem II stability/assembly factor-like uncharacterized protein
MRQFTSPRRGHEQHQRTAALGGGAPNHRLRRQPLRLTGAVLSLLALAATGARGAAAATPTPKPTEPPPPPSAVGQQLVQWISVSPAYRHTGLVVAMTAGPLCDKPCPQLWVSRDGGASWHQAAGKNWTPGRIVIASDGMGQDFLYSPATTGLLRSDDDGETWNAIGGIGTPTILPTYPKDGGVVVATAGNSPDYLIRNGAIKNVTGSIGAGKVADLQFLLSPAFPNGGSFSPALLFSHDAQSGQPVVFRCSTDFTCNGTPSILPGTDPSNPMSSVATVMFTSDDYAERGTVFAATPVGIDKSVDGGATFTPLNVVPVGQSKTTAIPMFALAPGYREAGPIRTAYAAVMQLFQDQKSAHVSGGVYRTTDGGKSWSPLANTGAFEGGAQALAVAPDGRFFAGYRDAYGHGGLLCSTDGKTWQASCPAVTDHANAAGGAAGTCNGCPAGNANSGSAQSVGGEAGATAAASGSTGGTVGSGALPAGAHPSDSGSTGRSTWIIVALIAVVVALAAGMGARWRRGRRAGTDAP